MSKHTTPEDLALPASVGFLLLRGEQAWDVALARFDIGDRAALGDLVFAYLRAPEFVARLARAPSPEEIAAVADIISGKKKPELRGRKREDTSPEMRFAATERVATIRKHRDAHVEEIGRARLEKRRHPKGWTEDQVRHGFKKAMEECAERFGVEVDTLEAWMKPSRGRYGTK